MKPFTLYKDENERKEWWHRYTELLRKLDISYTYDDTKAVAIEYLKLRGWKWDSMNPQTLLWMVMKSCLQECKQVIASDGQLANMIDRLPTS